MDLREVAVATMTWARDASEERLLRETLPELSALGAPVFVTDGGSGAALLDFMRGLPNFSVSGGGAGVWRQARASVRAAAGAAGGTSPSGWPGATRSSRRCGPGIP